MDSLNAAWAALQRSAGMVSPTIAMPLTGDRPYRRTKRLTR